MPLAVPGNTTCDIYNVEDVGYPGPGGSPSGQAVPVYLHGDYEQGLFAGDESGTPYDINAKWTHWMLVDDGALLKDFYSAGSWQSASASVVWVPDQNGTKFIVVYVERLNPGKAGAQKKIFLRRVQAAWPTNYS